MLMLPFLLQIHYYDDPIVIMTHSVLIVAVEGPADAGVSSAVKTMEKMTSSGTGWTIKTVLEEPDIHMDRNMGDLRDFAERHPEYMARYVHHRMTKSAARAWDAVQTAKQSGVNTIVILDRSPHGYLNVHDKSLYEQKLISEIDFFWWHRLYEDLPHVGVNGVMLFVPEAQEIINMKLHNRASEVVKAFNFDDNRRLTNSQVRKAITYGEKMKEAGIPVYSLDHSKKGAELKKSIMTGLDYVIDTYNNRYITDGDAFFIQRCNLG